MNGAPIELFLGHLAGVERNGAGWTARCPAHPDERSSLSVGVGDDGRVLVNCFTGCSFEAIVAATGLAARDLFPPRASNGRHGGGGGGGGIPPHDTATAQPRAAGGCTLAAYAAAKQLPLAFLRGLGLSDISYLGRPAVRMPYRDAGGAELAVQFRLTLEKSADADERFRFKSGCRPVLYGLWRLEDGRRIGRVALVEGASDCHTLWLHGVPAIGLPGAGLWREEWATHLDGIERIDVVLEPDRGGVAVDKWLATSRIRERAWLVRPSGFKDPSELHVRDPAAFPARWAAAVAGAERWTERAAADAGDRGRAAWARCRRLARARRILDLVGRKLVRCGVAGEDRAAKLLYLILTSRFVRPVSAGVKGPSAAGKSFLVERVAGFFPPEAYYALSAMSERALAYSEEPLAHRILIVYEAAGLRGDFASYLVRSLLSEGRVRYETVEKTADGLKPRLIEREGPTGLLVTTTALHLHPENETRLLSIPVTDSPAQTRHVLLALADEAERPVDLARWRALQTWLAGAEHRVTIPYRRALLERIPPVAVRLRRDAGAVLNLIRAHAVLHQATRARDRAGRVVADLDDYHVVRELVADLVAEGVEATVPTTVRETVAAVRTLTAGADKETTVAQAALQLAVDKATALRRVRVAQDRGYLKNLEDRRGRPARLVLGDPLPEDVPILPDPCALPVEGCTVAVRSGGIEAPPSPSTAPAPPRALLERVLELAELLGWPDLDIGRSRGRIGGRAEWLVFLDELADERALYDALAQLDRLGEHVEEEPS